MKPDRKSISLGELIRKEREYCGITQDQLAKQVGFKDRSSIHHIERGTRKLSAINFIEIAQVLHININQIQF